MQYLQEELKRQPIVSSSFLHAYMYACTCRCARLELSVIHDNAVPKQNLLSATSPSTFCFCITIYTYIYRPWRYTVHSPLSPSIPVCMHNNCMYMYMYMYKVINYSYFYRDWAEMSGISSKPPEQSTRRWGESSDTETTLVPSFYVMKGKGKKNHILCQN